VDVERIKEDPELSWLLEKPALNIWLADYERILEIRLTILLGLGTSGT
jgi:hypothetical protein